MSGPPDFRPGPATVGAVPTAPTGPVVPPQPDMSQSPIRSMLPDGTVLQFPPGTSPEVVDRVFKQKLGEFQATKYQASAPEPQKPQQQVGTGRAAGIGATQGLTFNLGDEIASGIAATVGYPPGRPGYPAGDTWDQRYDSALGEARGVQNAAQQQHPYAYGAGQVGGAVLPAIVAPEMFGGKFVASAPTMASAALRGGLTGGAYGAVTGFGRGEGGALNRTVAGAEDAVTNAAAGAISAPVVKGIAAAISPGASTPASAMAKKVGNFAYDAADSTPVEIAPSSIRTLADTIQDDMKKFGLRPKLQPLADGVMDEVNAIAANPNPTMQDLELLRRIAGRAFNPVNPSEGEASGRIIDHIDDFMENMKPADVVSGDADTAVKALQVARANWSAFRKADLLENAVKQAQDRAASSGTGGNLVNSIRQNLRKILDSPKLSRGFTNDEIAQIRAVERGGSMQNLARMFSVFAPSRGGLNAWLGAAASALPGGAMIPAIGEGAHRVAQDATLAAAQQLPRNIATGVGLNVAPTYSQLMSRALGANVPVSGSAADALSRALLPKLQGQQ